MRRRKNDPGRMPMWELGLRLFSNVVILVTIVPLCIAHDKLSDKIRDRFR